MIVWFTGHSGAGKSTIADALHQEIGCIALHGDDMRRSISTGLGFSKKDRRENNLRIARLAKELSVNHTVAVAVIAPSKEARKEVEEICDPIWIHVKRDIPAREDHWYDVSPEYPVIDTDKLTVPECVKEARKIIQGNERKPQSLFIGRWQPLHPGHIALIDKALAEGRDVTVGIRDTSYSDNDPYTVGERKDMIRKQFGDRVDFIVLPDILEVCYGREVGWGIREIRLDEDTESISGTKIRETKKRTNKA